MIKLFVANSKLVRSLNKSLFAPCGYKNATCGQISAPCEQISEHCVRRFEYKKSETSPVS
ncbi:Uncharacterised protein [Bacteroides heparinolyticus]|uniref:Uncharacterized protein n=1 Tax=Prevotella heparinolytica TaxID=28113 RepID=A0A449I5V1_9BACE|nr:Uncharacterised protein [Bacteroides heparinolyticus]